ncbi:MAG: anti-sigma F factor [Clostridia bacterium]|nr:anti-sigma F factor [Clostridia bacterium]
MAETNRLYAELPAISINESVSRVMISGFLMNIRGVTVGEIEEVKVALSEAVTNVILHAYPEDDKGKIYIKAILDGNQLTLKVWDKGCGIPNLTRAMEPMFSGSGSAERTGMGFTVMQSFMDGLDVRSSVDSGTSIVMTKHLGIGT